MYRVHEQEEDRISICDISHTQTRLLRWKERSEKKKEKKNKTRIDPSFDLLGGRRVLPSFASNSSPPEKNKAEKQIFIRKMRTIMANLVYISVRVVGICM
jgi:murein L,D-transpeptidase YafK